MANQKFINALENKAQKVPPVWMMRQAGRYHPPYQEKRKSHSFIELCKKPELAAQVALDPIADFDFDVSILFSDLLFPLEALGMGLDYNPAPALGWHLQEASDFKKMRTVDQAIEDLAFQKDALEATRKVLPDDKSLIGFVGSPWTLFVYAVAGSHKGTLADVKQRMSLFPAFCEIMGALLEKNIELQLEGGAEVVMLFDTAAGDLSPLSYEKYLAPFLINLSKKFSGKLGYYSKTTGPDHLKQLWGKADFAGFGYDHRWDLGQCFDKASGFTQGNFDQTLLFLPENEFETAFREYLKPMTQLTPEQKLGWVCGLGHGVLPKTPNNNVRNFVKIVREVFA
ncbi:MAG: uroporphyrinogen decarboxylase [Bdellovibrionales bacterium]|nr:uroporphyrinogen decarboxylase [Bdellovibrionales bacterium]